MIKKLKRVNSNESLICYANIYIRVEVDTSQVRFGVFMVSNQTNLVSVSENRSDRSSTVADLHVLDGI